MRKTTALAALAAVAVAPLTILTSCGGGGGGGSGAGSGNAASATLGTIHLLAHAPADGDIEVAVDATIELEFDSAIAADSLGDEDTWLRRRGSNQNLAGSFTFRSGGRQVTFRPAQPLSLESDYDFQLSGLTCDQDGRLLDVTETFTFRTIDNTPPQLIAVDVAPNSTGRSRTNPFTFTFTEAIAPASLTPASLYLQDVFGHVYPASRTTLGNTVVFQPLADLPGDRGFTLTMTTATTDRSGNPLQTVSITHFRTMGDADAPSVVSMWPAQGATSISPVVQPTYRFSESMDPHTVEPSSLIFQDQFGSFVPFAIHASDDQRTLRVRPTMPLQQGRRYTLAFLLGGAAATDVSGNGLDATQALVFTTGIDSTAPTVASSSPALGETRVSINAVLTVNFGEAIDSAWVGPATVRLMAGGAEALAAVIEQPTPTMLRITPVLQLPLDTTCTLTLFGGHAGLHDIAGNVLAADYSLSFTTSNSTVLPRALLMPPDGATGVPRTAHVRIVFDAGMDPTTLTNDTVQVQDDSGTVIPGTLVIGGGNRTVLFTPDTAFAPSTYYRTRVRGGSGGVRATSGNWFTTDQQARYRTSTGNDTTNPIVRATINSIDDSRNVGLVLPPHGFTIDVTVTDPGDQSIDMGSIEVLFAGAGTAPGSPQLFAPATIGYSTFSVRVPATAPLSPGSWTVTVEATDLSGNRGTSTALAFSVAEPTAGLLPFERTQVVWVRTDLDRDGSRTADFDEDLLLLGLATAGDPAGRNLRMRNLLLDGILTTANRLYGRGSRGEPLDSASAGLRFTKRAPIAVTHMQMALGGMDPEGQSGRSYGSESSGVLGRAFYDYRNGNMGDRNTGTSPGLGVFPAEMWLYQTNIHIQVWPSYQTTFARRFRPLCPAMGGTPAGAHELDAIVLAESFNYAAATTNQRARWLTIMQAVDDWAAVMGIILAHEVGHAVGLVAPGPAPAGLFGDATLHNTYAGAAEVMAPSVGYEAMTTLDYSFRDIDHAYLRQRIMLR